MSEQTPAPRTGPTQVEHPWRTVARTVFQVAAGLIVLLPIVAGEFGLDAQTGGVIGGVLAVCAVAARIMAMPAVNDFLARFRILAWLAPEPKPKPEQPTT